MRQLYVVAQSNDGSDGLSNFATAKNSLAVGSVFDTGEITYFSSHGPTADGRLAPLVVGTGFDVCSAKGEGSSSGYTCFNGTSMASPSVAGVAALLMDAEPAYQQNPALTRATLMASAIRPDVWLDNPSGIPLHNSHGPGDLQSRYGLGKVSAITSILTNNSPEGWVGGSAAAVITREGDYAYHDVVIPPNVERLDIVLTWDEIPVDVVLSPVLNDLDLWVDYQNDCDMDEGACGETASRSRVDNVEWLIIRNPTPGTYRVKVVANRIYSEPPRAAISWVVLRGSATPILDLNIEDTRTSVLSSQSLTALALSLSVSEYVSTGTRLHFSCVGSTDDCANLTLEDLKVHRLDGVTINGSVVARRSTETPETISINARVPLGDIAFETNRHIELSVRYAGRNPIRFLLTASSLNGVADLETVEITPSESSIVEDSIGQLENDGYSGSLPLIGERGSILVPLSGSTTESGEPLYLGPCVNNDCYANDYRPGCPLIRYSEYYKRPAGSVWYRWTSKENDVVRMKLVHKDGSLPDGVFLTVYRGDTLGTLEQEASNHWEEAEFYSRPCIYEAVRHVTDTLSFIAHRGETYHIRVATDNFVDPLTLHWEQGRPKNDDFQNAIVIRGETGSIRGGNTGATTQAGESFGSLSASVWYQWIAPKDGSYEFEIGDEDLRVSVFAGTSVRSARLVSQFPSDEAKFLASEGKNYRIMVAAATGSVYPKSFELNWRSCRWCSFYGNDLYQNSDEIVVGDDLYASLNESTVEPSEPIETGIRTKWWQLKNGQTQNYTLKSKNEDIDLSVNVFTGQTLSTLDLKASNAENRTTGELKFLGEEGQHYSISLGWPMGDNRAFLGEYGSFSSWTIGATPENDERGGAIALSGREGSITASAEFATTGDGELTDFLGRWSLWWQFESPESNWYRFYVLPAEGSYFAPDVAIAIYESGNSVSPISRNGWLKNESSAMFYATEGQKFTVRVGITGYGFDTDYVLAWERTSPPTWIRYAGSFDRQAEGTGRLVPIEAPNQLEISSDGSVLFATTLKGLAMYSLNGANGQLTPTRTENLDISNDLLIWDKERKRLLVNRCHRWRAFSVSHESSSPTLQQSSVMVQGATEKCATTMKLVGKSIYRVIFQQGIENYILGDDGSLQFTDVTNIDELVSIVANEDGTRIYTSGSRLTEFARDIDNGALTVLDDTFWGSEASLAVSKSGEQLFTTDMDRYPSVYVFDLSRGLDNNSDSLSIRWELQQLEPAILRSWSRSFARHDQNAIDILGKDGAISVMWNEEELVLGDELGDGRDRFGNFVPLFGSPIDSVETPDGRFLYLSTERHGILVFERVPIENSAR